MPKHVCTPQNIDMISRANRLQTTSMGVPLQAESVNELLLAPRHKVANAQSLRAQVSQHLASSSSRMKPNGRTALVHLRVREPLRWLPCICTVSSLSSLSSTNCGIADVLPQPAPVKPAQPAPRQHQPPCHRTAPAKSCLCATTGMLTTADKMQLR